MTEELPNKDIPQRGGREGTNRYMIYKIYNKMKNYKYHNVRTVPNSNREIVETAFDIPSTLIQDRSATWIAT